MRAVTQIEEKDEVTVSRSSSESFEAREAAAYTKRNTKVRKGMYRNHSVVYRSMKRLTDPMCTTWKRLDNMVVPIVSKTRIHTTW